MAASVLQIYPPALDPVNNAVAPTMVMTVASDVIVLAWSMRSVRYGQCKSPTIRWRVTDASGFALICNIFSMHLASFAHML